MAGRTSRAICKLDSIPTRSAGFRSPLGSPLPECPLRAFLTAFTCSGMLLTNMGSSTRPINSCEIVGAVCLTAAIISCAQNTARDALTMKTAMHMSSRGSLVLMLTPLVDLSSGSCNGFSDEVSCLAILSDSSIIVLEDAPWVAA